MPFPKQISDEQISVAYREHGGVRSAGKALGISGQSVHERLVKLGLNRPVNLWKPECDEILRDQYLAFRDAGRIELLAKRLGRTKYFLCRQARRLGLTDQAHKRFYIGKWKYMDEATAARLMAEFKRSSLGMGRFCKTRGLDELGFARTLRRFFPDEWEHVIESKVPKTTRYRIGRQFEYRVRDDLRARGYFVMRSPASRSPIDLLAVKKGTVLFVQCKTGAALAPAEWNVLFDLAESVAALPILASREDGRTLTYRLMLARKTGKKTAQPYGPFDPGVKP